MKTLATFNSVKVNIPWIQPASSNNFHFWMTKNPLSQRHRSGHAAFCFFSSPPEWCKVVVLLVVVVVAVKLLKTYPISRWIELSPSTIRISKKTFNKTSWFLPFFNKFMGEAPMFSCKDLVHHPTDRQHL